MARLKTKLQSFYRTHQSSLYTFVMLAAERVLQMFIGLWIASHIARRFDHATFANWQIAMSLWLVFGTIGSISGERVLLPRICAEPAETMPRLWNTALAAKLISGLLTAVPLVLWCATMPDPTILQLAILWAVQLVIGQPVSLAVHEYYAHENFRFPQIARILAMFSRLGIVMIVMWVNGPVTWVVWGWIIEMLVMSALLCRNWLSDARIRPSLVDWKLMRGLFAQGAALAVASSASVALSRIDRVTLGKTMPADVLSQYAAAMTLLEAAFAFAAMLAVVVMCVGGSASWKQIQEHTEWGVLMLFGGGLVLSIVMKDTGASKILADSIVAAVGHQHPVIIMLALTSFVVFLTEFTSNTATAALLMPIFITVARTLQLPDIALAAIIACGASCAFMLPIATPPNAIVYATGKIRLGEMVRVGLLLNIACILIIGLLAHGLWVHW